MRDHAVVIKDTLPIAPTDFHRPNRCPSTRQKETCVKALHLEDLSNNIPPPPSPIRATLLNIFGVVSRNYVLARLGVVHNGLGVWEKSIKAPIEDAGRDEGVEIADIETT